MKAEHYGEWRRPPPPLATVAFTALLPVIGLGLTLIASLFVEPSAARQASAVAVILSLGTTPLSAFWLASRRSTNRWERAGLAGLYAALIGVVVSLVGFVVWMMLSSDWEREAYGPMAAVLYHTPALAEVAIASVIALVFQPYSRSGDLNG